MLSDLQFRLLCLVAPKPAARMRGGAYVGKSKLKVLLPEIENEIRGKVVLDFGCGSGAETREMAQLGARHVIGLDSSEKWLRIAQEQAEKAGVASRCEFVTSAENPVQVIVSLDCFEHFSDPEAVLENMYSLLEPGGCVLVSFGPTWYHPLGGHLFSVFPWAHLVFREEALIRWRNQFKSDGATRFGEIEGGLNQMTIRRFEEILQRTQFSVEQFELVAIRKLKPFHNHMTREFLTAIVRCRLRKAPLARATES